MLTAIALGFALGIRHAADPDHIAAVAALVARQRSAWAAAWLGALWGVGHSAMVLAVGGLLVALRVATLPRWAALAELGVAAMLIALGVSNLRGLGAHANAGADRPHVGGAWRSLGVGILHGLAGSAAVALLALTAMPSAGAALAYLAVFALGTIGGMVALSLGLGLPAAFARDRPGFARWALAGSGCLSIAVGLYLVVEVGVATRLL